MADVSAAPELPTVAVPASSPGAVPPLPPMTQRIVTGAIAAGLAAAIAAVVDGLWSWSSLGQYLPTAVDRIRFGLYLVSIYALTGGLAGAALTVAGVSLIRTTRLGTLLRHALREHDRAREREPRDAIIGLSLVIAWIPLFAVALGLAWSTLDRLLAGRKHEGLVIASAMGGALVALAASLVVALIVGRGVELVIRAVARGAVAHRLASPWSPVIAALVLVAIGILAVAIAARKTLVMLPLRPAAVALLAAALIAPMVPVALRLAARWQRGRRRVGVLAAALALPLGVAFAAGAEPAVVKAAVAYSGGGDAITAGLQRAIDLDRDGHAAILGGGDCNDLDADVHPGAADVPDDGIDQNCLAGDARTDRSLAEVGFAPVPASVPADFNLVLITIDTLRADHVGAYGYARATTPNLDALAAEGALFTSSWAHAPSTRYSIPAILTGRLPLQVDYNTSIAGWPGLSLKATTVAEVVRAGGFATGAFTNYWYFDPVRAMNQGFDVYDNRNASLHAGSNPAHTTGTSSRQQTDKAIGFVADHADRRFFLWVHYYDPHHTYQSHPELDSFGPSEPDRYDDEIRFTDLHIGRLLDDLRRRGLWNKTAVIVTGDHGEGFGEHDIEFHGYDLYAAQTRVPLIIRVPGLPPRRIATAAGHVDLLPTVANLIGGAPSTEMMGRSLVPWLTGAPDDLDRAVFQQVSYEGNHEKRGAATARCHVLYNVSPHTSWELYRVEADPAETRDLSAAPGPCASALRTFERWYDSAEIPPGAAAALLPGRPPVARPLDVELGAEVRLLGFEAPPAARAGDTIDLTWTFEVRGRLRGDWWIFTHFEGPGRFTADHRPPRPTAWWRAGQFLRYTVSATVPAGTPPGKYTVWAGMFQARKGTRRPVRAPAAIAVADRRAAIGTLEVTR